ncbi:hypothetical protein N9887_00460 [Flavobacteriaceae bacterium]|nr:hypothetical protein [Flavobacteriaceae bacterium]MDC1266121.1 hypothetical protein [Flavobacteriaceae bacterium]
MKTNNKLTYLIVATCFLCQFYGMVLYGQNSNQAGSVEYESYTAKSNMDYKKNIQLAHYPLTARIHNTALQDYFLEVYPYDVSGNYSHGTYMNFSKRKLEENNLEYPETTPFHPMYSRVKKKTTLGYFDANNQSRYVTNPGKKFLDPDSYLVKYTVDNDGTAKTAKLRKMIWDVDGDGVRSEIQQVVQNTPTIDNTIVVAGNENQRRLEKMLKTPLKTNVQANTFFSFPEPFTKKTTKTKDFTVSFWLNATGTDFCNRVMPIIDTKYFIIEMHNRYIKFTRKENGVKVEGDSFDTFTNLGCSTYGLKDRWLFYTFTYNKDANELRSYIKRLSVTDPNNILKSNSTSNFSAPILPSNFNSDNTTTQAKMMGTNFTGSLYSVRFINREINPNGITNIYQTDTKILRRKVDKNHYLDKGLNYLNRLDGNTSNRFGSEGKAKQFNNDENLIIKKFLPKDYDASQGYTVSFWTKIEQDLTNDDVFPFDANPANPDTRHQFFYGASDLDIYAGMQRVKDKLGVNRYFYNEDTYEKSPIFSWFWEPGAFNRKGGCASPPCQATGWYHVVLVYYPSMMRMYLFHPGQQDVYRRLLYLGAQNVSDVQEWGLGKPKNLSNLKYPAQIEAAPYLDDFKVYSWPLGLNDVKTLHKMSLSQNYSESIKTSSLSSVESLNTEHVGYSSFGPGAIAGTTIGTIALIGTGGYLFYKFGVPRMFGNNIPPNPDDDINELSNLLCKLKIE